LVYLLACNGDIKDSLLVVWLHLIIHPAIS